jgi:hypothetical protein
MMEQRHIFHSYCFSAGFAAGFSSYILRWTQLAKLLFGICFIIVVYRAFIPLSA